MSELVNSYLSRKKIKPNSRWFNVLTAEEFIILDIPYPGLASDKEYIMVKYYQSPYKYVLTNFDLMLSDIETETIICIHDPTVE